jgi:ABC-type uncharacterized transport system substrate-binding protein
VNTPRVGVSGFNSPFSFVWLILVALMPSAPVIAQDFRVVYFSFQEESGIKQHVEELKAELNAKWPKSFRPQQRDIRIEAHFIPAESKVPDSVGAASRRYIEHVLNSRPSLIYASGAGLVKVISGLTKEIPIVMSCLCNPGPTSSRKLIENVCAPEKNLTGFTSYDLRSTEGSDNAICNAGKDGGVPTLDNLQTVRLQILKDSSEPSVQRIGFFYGDDFDEAKWKYKEKAAKLGISLVYIRLDEKNMADIARLFQENNLDAGLMAADVFQRQHSERLVSITSAISKPTMFPWDEADIGAWMHYSPKVDKVKEAISYIVPILQGKPIRELPVSFPKEYELVVNHKLAKERGWVFSKKFLLYPQREPKLR